MKKIISLIIVSLITLLSIWNVNAMGSIYESEILKIDWKEIWKYQQIKWISKFNWIYYIDYSGLDWEYWNLKIENWKVSKISEDKYYKIVSENMKKEINSDYKNIKVENKSYNKKINYVVDWKNTEWEAYLCEFTVNWKKYWPFITWNWENWCDVIKLDNNSFYYYWRDNYDSKNNKAINDWTFIRTWNIITIKSVKIEETKLKPIPKIDRVLNKFFAKVDKKWEIKSKALYKKIIKKIDSIISKTKSYKKKKLLEYIKIKFEEKVK